MSIEDTEPLIAWETPLYTREIVYGKVCERFPREPRNNKGHSRDGAGVYEVRTDTLSISWVIWTPQDGEPEDSGAMSGFRLGYFTAGLHAEMRRDGNPCTLVEAATLIRRRDQRSWDALRGQT